MRPIFARPDGELEVLGGFRPAARSGGRVLKLELTETIPLPEGTTLMHLPGRRALALDSKDRPIDVEADLQLGVEQLLDGVRRRSVFLRSLKAPCRSQVRLGHFTNIVRLSEGDIATAIGHDQSSMHMPSTLLETGKEARASFEITYEHRRPIQARCLCEHVIRGDIGVELVDEQVVQVEPERQLVVEDREPVPRSFGPSPAHVPPCHGCLAEGEGFEPPSPWRGLRFSRPLRSTAPASLRGMRPSSKSARG